MLFFQIVALLNRRCLYFEIKSKRGDKMGQDTIQAIRDAEQKADQIEQQSAAECASLLVQARSQAKTETAEALAKARADSRQILQRRARNRMKRWRRRLLMRNPKFGSCVKLRRPKKRKPFG